MFVQSETQQILHVSKKKIPRVFYLGSYDFLNWYVINESENNNL